VVTLDGTRREDRRSRVAILDMLEVTLECTRRADRDVHRALAGLGRPRRGADRTGRAGGGDQHPLQRPARAPGERAIGPLLLAEVRGRALAEPRHHRVLRMRQRRLDEQGRRRHV
jgi:hypothetical protein